VLFYLEKTGLSFLQTNAKYLVIGTAIFLIEQRVLETNAGKQLS
jgi:hypothetical protein